MARQWKSGASRPAWTKAFTSSPTTYEDVRLGDVRGVRLSFRYRASLVGSDPTVLLETHLEDARGRPVLSAVEGDHLRDGDGRLRTKTKLAVAGSGGWQQGTAFLPFYAMKLRPGAHKVVAKLSALGLAESGLEKRQIEVRGAEPAEVEIVKPHAWTVEVGVSAVSVDHREYDKAASGTRAALPDVSWQASFDALSSEPFYRAPTKTDQYDTTWRRTTGPFPWSEGDRLSIRVVDVDLVDHEQLGGFSLSLDELEQASKSGRIFKVRRVVSLELGTVKIR